jgi:hypothetical protein
LNQKAEAWWDLSLNRLGDALTQSFKLPANPMKNPRLADEWEPCLQEKRKGVTHSMVHFCAEKPAHAMG